MKLHSFDICQPCNQLYQLYSPRCLLRSGDQIELALWKNGVFVLASDQLLAIHKQPYVSILLRRKNITTIYQLCTLPYQKSFNEVFNERSRHFNVRFLSSVALRIKQWQIFNLYSHFPDIRDVIIWTYLHFLKYDQNEHELITNQAIFIKQKKFQFILPAGV